VVLVPCDDSDGWLEPCSIRYGFDSCDNTGVPTASFVPPHDRRPSSTRIAFHSVEVGSPPYFPLIHVRKLVYSLPLTALSVGSSRINFLWMYKYHYYYSQQMYPLTNIAKCRVYIFSVVRSMGTLYTPMICLASLGVSWALNLMYGVIPRTYMTGWMTTFKWRVDLIVTFSRRREILLPSHDTTSKPFGFCVHSSCQSLS
jgi:hypothetical protein